MHLVLLIAFCYFSTNIKYIKLKRRTFWCYVWNIYTKEEPQKMLAVNTYTLVTVPM